MKLRIAAALALTTAMVAPGAGLADSALDTLQAMHMTPPIDWPTIPQTGPKADQVKQILTKIKMPPGFHIDLYANYRRFRSKYRTLSSPARRIAAGRGDQEVVAEI